MEDRSVGCGVGTVQGELLATHASGQIFGEDVAHLYEWMVEQQVKLMIRSGDEQLEVYCYPNGLKSLCSRLESLGHDMRTHQLHISDHELVVSEIVENSVISLVRLQSLEISCEDVILPIVLDESEDLNWLKSRIRAALSKNNDWLIIPSLDSIHGTSTLETGARCFLVRKHQLVPKEAKVSWDGRNTPLPEKGVFRII
jgi:hypothetical protein